MFQNTQKVTTKMETAEKSANKEVNRDYIATIVNNNGSLSYEEIDIVPQNEGLISVINSFVNHEDISLPDMQEVFSHIYIGKPTSFSYCIPHEYSETYIDHAIYPKIYNKIEFDKETRELRNNLICKAQENAIKEDSHNKNKKLSDDEVRKIEEMADKTVADYVSDLKQKFAKDAVRYIMASTFNEALDKIKTSKDNIIYSTETIGWTKFKYDVNKDLSISIKTNFCYGSSTYFHVTLIYKGIQILSYPKLVLYYYANMIDFIDCTVSFAKKRRSWKNALSFIVETSIFAIKDEEAFVNKWIIDGVKTLIDGLNDILLRPDYVIEGLLKRKLEDKDLFAVRNITDDEISEYKIYRNEMTISFQAEKISGTLLLINNLEKLSALYKEIDPAIEKIKHINKVFFPTLHHNIKNIELKLKNASDKLNMLHKEYGIIKRENRGIFNDIKSFMNKEENITKTVSEYLSLHPENEIIYKEAETIKEQIDAAEAEEKRLKKLKFQLYKCAQLICDYGLAQYYEDEYLSTNVNRSQKLISIMDGSLRISRNKRRLIESLNNMKEFNVTLPNTIEVICDSSFSKNSMMKKIQFPNSLIIIGDNAFQGCTNLTEIDLPDSLTTLGGNLFWGCVNLKKIKISRGIKEVCPWTFANCQALDTVEIPNSIEKIGEHAFDGCKSLRTIHLPRSVSYIGEDIFKGCDSLYKIFISKGTKPIFKRLLWEYKYYIVEE
jgi:hypothetical protein